MMVTVMVMVMVMMMLKGKMLHHFEGGNSKEIQEKFYDISIEI